MISFHNTFTCFLYHLHYQFQCSGIFTLAKSECTMPWKKPGDNFALLYLYFYSLMYTM